MSEIARRRRACNCAVCRGRLLQEEDWREMAIGRSVVTGACAVTGRIDLRSQTALRTKLLRRRGASATRKEIDKIRALGRLLSDRPSCSHSMACRSPSRSRCRIQRYNLQMIKTNHCCSEGIWRLFYWMAWLFSALWKYTLAGGEKSRM